MSDVGSESCPTGIHLFSYHSVTFNSTLFIALSGSQSRIIKRYDNEREQTGNGAFTETDIYPADEGSSYIISILTIIVKRLIY